MEAKSQLNLLPTPTAISGSLLRDRSTLATTTKTLQQQEAQTAIDESIVSGMKATLGADGSPEAAQASYDMQMAQTLSQQGISPVSATPNAPATTETNQINALASNLWDEQGLEKDYSLYTQYWSDHSGANSATYQAITPSGQWTQNIINETNDAEEDESAITSDTQAQTDTDLKTLTTFNTDIANIQTDENLAQASTLKAAHLSSEISPLTTALSALQTSSTADQGSVTELNSTISETQNNLNQLQNASLAQTIDSLSDQTQTHSHALQNLQTQSSALSQNLTTTQDHIQGLTTRVSDIEQQTQTHSHALQNLQTHSSALAQNLTAAQDQIQEIATHVSDIEQQTQTHSSALKNIQTQSSALAQILTTAQDQIQEITTHMSHIGQQTTALSAEGAQTDQIQSDSINALTLNLQRLSDQLAQTKADVSQLKTDQQTATQKEEASKANEESLQEQVEKASLTLSTLQQKTQEQAQTIKATNLALKEQEALLHQTQSTSSQDSQALKNLPNQIDSLKERLSKAELNLKTLQTQTNQAKSNLSLAKKNEESTTKVIQDNLSQYGALLKDATYLKQQWIATRQLSFPVQYNKLIQDIQAVCATLETYGYHNLSIPHPIIDDVSQEEISDISDDEDDGMEAQDTILDDEKGDEQSLDKLAKSQSMASGLIPTPGVLPAGDQVVTGDKT